MNQKLFESVYEHPLITKDELTQIMNAHEKVNFKKGNFILTENQIANEYFIIERGLMRSFVYDYDGEDITTNFFSENEILIEVSSLFQRIPTKENIQALTDCVCWKIEFQVFQQLFHSVDSFREWGRAWMSSSLFYFKQRSVSFLTDSATSRYFTLIKEKPQVLQFAPLKNIATYLGITDSSLSRIRKEIVKK
jgi:CRP-like cAMP-binding protein